MNIQNTEKDAGQIAVRDAAPGSALIRKRRTTPSNYGQPRAKSKQDHLVALLSKPNGVRVSVISNRLGWQAHTVRAAISGLRKRGYEIVTSKSQKTGEMVYAIIAADEESEAEAAEASS